MQQHGHEHFKFKPNTSIYTIYKITENSSLQKAKIKNNERQKKKKLEQLKKDEAACNSHLQKDRLRKVVKNVIFHLVYKLKGLWFTASHLYIHFLQLFEITVWTIYYLKCG